MHAGEAGHCVSDATWNSLCEGFYWTGQQNDVREFVSACLHCRLSKSGEEIPRTLASTSHAKLPNEIIQFDYLFIGESKSDKKYVLVVKDDLSGYC